MNYLRTCWADFFQILIVRCLGPHGRTYFEFLKPKTRVIQFFTYFFFVNIGGENGGENFKTILPLQIPFELFQTFPTFFFIHSVLPNFVFHFLNFGKLNLNDFCFVFFNMGAYGSENFKILLLL